MKRSGLQLHIGLIGNGVRRWAKQHNIVLLHAYIAAMERVGVFINYFFQHNTNTLSLYMLSKENLGREKKELDDAIEGEIIFFKTILKDLVQKWECNVHLAGDPTLLPTEYVGSISELAELSALSERKLYLLAAYNPVDEIRQAVQKGGTNFWNYLWVPEPVDIVIRTSGEHRASNFLPLQAGYAELFFLQKHINDLTEQDCRLVLDEYYKRNRRFGK